MGCHRPRLPVIAGAIACQFLLLAAVFQPAVAADIRLGVAANFTATTAKLIDAFESRTGHSVTASFGSTGTLYTQIRNGAPYDVFMAADALRPALIEAANVGVADSRFTYARGNLVLWSPSPDELGNATHYLTRQRFNRLAIANPKTAPYGQAAQQVMEHIGAWEAMQGRLVRGQSIAQTFQFVASANVPAGFVALSQVKGSTGHPGSLWRVPQSYYQPIEQQAILLNRGADKNAAQAWMRFLQSDTAAAIIREDGYGTAP